MRTKYYLTRYALTKGLIEIELELIEKAFGFLNIDVFETYEEACLNAEQRKIKAIDSLKSRIKKLENKHFINSSKKERTIDPEKTIFYHQDGG